MQHMRKAHAIPKMGSGSKLFLSKFYLSQNLKIPRHKFWDKAFSPTFGVTLGNLHVIFHLSPKKDNFFEKWYLAIVDKNSGAVDDL